MIVERLHVIQDRHGFLPDAELRAFARESGTPLYRIQEVASFFPHFRQEWDRPAAVEVKVCRDMSCHLAGSGDLLHAKTGLKEVARDGVVVAGTSCLGRCDRAPACSISRHVPGDDAKSFHDHLYAGLSTEKLKAAVAAIVAGGDPPPETPDLAHPASDPKTWAIDVYRDNAYPPYEATRRFLKAHPLPIRPGRPPKLELPKDLPDAEVEKRKKRHTDEHNKALHPFLWQLQQSNLLGMGGAGMPVYQKWFDVWQGAGSEKYIVCNGDESEPGTFKDRELLLRTPHLVVEGVLLGVLMTGGSAGYIFIRHEYPEQIEACRAEIERAETELAEAFGLASRAFPPIEVFVSPGGYICGEQSALIEAMEDRRAQPRNRPPELQSNGLRDRPTAVNNVETLAWVPSVVLHGGEWYAKQGRPGCKGRRFFSISGDLRKPGVFEVPIGTTLGELIDLAGGVLPGRTLKAVATSGPSGGFVPARLPIQPGIEARLEKALPRLRDPAEGDLLKRFAADHLMPGGVEQPALDIRALPLDLNFFRGVGSLIGLRLDLMLGAGIVVYDDSRDMLVEARNCTQFFRNESCGKCVPCRIGAHKLVGVGTQLLRRRTVRPPNDGDADGAPQEFMVKVKDNVLELARVMSLTSICGLGPSAPNPLATVLEFFPRDTTPAPRKPPPGLRPASDPSMEIQLPPE
jgi:formate dehydrogenase beta subunit